MTCRTPWRWSRPYAGALLALLAAAFAPSPAHAGCGTPRGPYHGSGVMPAQAPALPADAPAAPGEGTPCHGQGCSQGPSQPLTVPVAPPSAAGQDLACATPRPPLAGPGSSPHRRDEAPSPPSPHHAAVYHPPR
ncbi:MAG TPA: hypothetical protein VFE78_01620 [Gemmataceae bacterium]|nr:hypothetical protein [Gemmataceae bacterium]